jgi:hypothetical protein
MIKNGADLLIGPSWGLDIIVALSDYATDIK